MMSVSHKDTEPAWKGSLPQNLEQSEYQIIKDKSEPWTIKE